MGIMRWCVIWPFGKKRSPKIGKPAKKELASFFENYECPDCGTNDQWHCWEDGGHDIAIECLKCHSSFGVQMPPFNMIERITPNGQFVH